MEEYKDKIIICKDCGKEFVLPAYRNVIPLKEEYKKLKERISKLEEKGLSSEAQILTLELNHISNLQYDSVYIQSQESLDEAGFTNIPSRCMDCMSKAKERRYQTKKN